MIFRRSVLVLASLCIVVTAAPGCGAKKKRLANADKMQQLGRAKLAEGDAEGAVADLTQAAKADPKNAETKHLLGLAYWNKGTVLKDDSLKMEAEKIILESFELKGDEAVPGDWRNNLGALYVDLRRWSEAVVELQKAMKDPEYRTPERPLNNLCKASLEQNKYAEAVEYCERALRVQPRFCMALVNKGLALGQLKKAPDAIDSFKKVTEIEECQAWPEPYLRLGILYLQLGKKNEAKQFLMKAKQLDPEGQVGKEADQYLRSLGR